MRHRPGSTLFPYTTLFRSYRPARAELRRRRHRGVADRRCRDIAEEPGGDRRRAARSEEHTSELQSQSNLVCRLLLEKKKTPNSPSGSKRCDTTAIRTNTSS